MASPAFGLNETTNLTAIDIQQRSITVEWTANNTQHNTSVYLDGVFYANVVTPVTGNQTKQITGLTKGTSYLVSTRTMNNTLPLTPSGWLNITVVTYGDLGQLWNLIEGLVDNQGAIIGIIILIVVLLIVRKFGKSLGGILKIGN